MEFQWHGLNSMEFHFFIKIIKLSNMEIPYGIIVTSLHDDSRTG